MRRMTLLEIVQDILSDMDSDEVNSINDTVEAMQVANIVRSVYEHLIDNRDWPHLYEVFALTSSATSLRPTHMIIPDNIEEVEWFKYNKKKVTDVNDRYDYVKYKLPVDFMELVDQRNSSVDTVDVITDPTGITLNILNNIAPSYFTSFDNNTVVCDSYDSAVDDTLQSSKTKCHGKRLPVFTLTDTFVPDLPDHAFSMLLNEAKSTASMKLKQTPDQKAEQYAITGRRKMSQEAWKLKSGINYPNYGRQGKK